MLPVMVWPTPLTLLASPELPPLPSPLLLEDTPVLADMSPTLPESSMLPRGLLMLSLRLMPTMVLTVLDTAMVVSMEDMESVPMVPTPMPMVPTMARGPLMLSPRLMLMLSMVLMVLAMAMVDTVLAMLDMPLPTPMVLTMARGLLILSPRLMPTMVPMALVDFMEDMESVPMVPTPMPMVSMKVR